MIAAAGGWYEYLRGQRIKREAEALKASAKAEDNNKPGGGG